jgi:DNA-binding beta-propeller fold protein YncE
MHALRTAALGAVAGLALGSFAQAQPFYQLESTLMIKSPNVPNWDYLAYDPQHDYLYISRREDGILIYDAKAKKIIGTIENTKGGNATTLVPDFGRGYVTNLDGSVTVFDLSTLKTTERIKFGKDADNAFYDPVTRQLLVTMGDSKQAAFLDAKTGQLVGKLDFDSEKLEGTVPDGEGNMFMALRDRNKVVRVDMKQRKVTAEWQPEDCVLPNGAAYDRANKRLFVSCRGNNPILAVIDPATGKTVAKPAIGRGNDVIIFDPESHKIYSSNGFDGTLVVIDQVDANTYKLSEATTTRPYARTMALDPKTKKVYLVTAEGTVDPSKSWKSEIAAFYPNKYFADTFNLLTYASK